ncbi:hypothetical protein ACFL6I_02465 [candidate division KSB1 bacterium]
MKSTFFQKYLLPGFVFQSVVIAGGYGTGREIVEYFLMYGPLGGLLGMLLVSTVMWSVTLALTFEFARFFKAYDYRTFFTRLFGRFWFIFEILYLYGLLLILAVIGSAAGAVLRDNFGIPYMWGVVIMFAAVGFLTFRGSGLIEKFLASWSIVLYIIYFIILIAALAKFGGKISGTFAGLEKSPGWLKAGFQYALYNFNVIPATLFCLHHIETRKEAIGAGLLGGIIGIFPGLLFFISIISQYPDVLPEELPIIYMLDEIGQPVLLIVFQIVLFGTLIETGTGMIHAFNERIQSAFHAAGKEFPRRLRPVVAVLLLFCGLGIASFGLVALIAQGYGSLSWGVLFVFVIPLFTLGIYRMVKGSPEN